MSEEKNNENQEQLDIHISEPSHSKEENLKKETGSRFAIIAIITLLLGIADVILYLRPSKNKDNDTPPLTTQRDSWSNRTQNEQYATMSFLGRTGSRRAVRKVIRTLWEESKQAGVIRKTEQEARKEIREAARIAERASKEAEAAVIHKKALDFGVMKTEKEAREAFEAAERKEDYLEMSKARCTVQVTEQQEASARRQAKEAEEEVTRTAEEVIRTSKKAQEARDRHKKLKENLKGLEHIEIDSSGAFYRYIYSHFL